MTRVILEEVVFVFSSSSREYESDGADGEVERERLAMEPVYCHNAIEVENC